MTEKKWIGTWPKNCDICGSPLEQEWSFIDGKTTMGPWALMCPSCHVGVGVGLGTGKGQEYSAETLIKIGG